MTGLIQNIYFLVTSGGVEAITETGADKLALTGMAVVFSGLVALTVVLYLLGGTIEKFKAVITGIKNWFSAQWKNITGKKAEDSEEEEVVKKPVKGEHAAPLTGETAAAICLSILLYRRMHMSEYRERLTTSSHVRKFSPWSLSGKVHPTRRYTR
ncbi:MAG: OadG family protein [Vulcanimicrobiota bacterium]